MLVFILEKIVTISEANDLQTNFNDPKWPKLKQQMAENKNKQL